MTSDDEEDTWEHWKEPDWTESHSRILSEIKDELVDELMEIYSSKPEVKPGLRERIEKVLEGPNPFKGGEEIRPTFFRIAQRRFGPQSMNYQILESNTSSELTDQVNLAILAGWKPLGSVSVGGRGGQNHLGHWVERSTFRFAQAMIKETL